MYNKLNTGNEKPPKFIKWQALLTSLGIFIYGATDAEAGLRRIDLGKEDKIENQETTNEEIDAVKTKIKKLKGDEIWQEMEDMHSHVMEMEMLVGEIDNNITVINQRIQKAYTNQGDIEIRNVTIEKENEKKDILYQQRSEIEESIKRLKKYIDIYLEEAASKQKEGAPGIIS